MASVIVFPNVATHRKLPHLQPKDGHNKDPTKDKTPNTAASTAAAGADSSQDTLRNGLQHLSIQDGNKQQQPPALTQGHQRPLILPPASTEDASATAAAAVVAAQLPRLIEPVDPKQAGAHLIIDTHHNNSKDTSPFTSAVSSSSSSSIRPLSSSSDSSYSALPPSGLSANSKLNAQHHHHSADLLKTAIYDAFGCLYHPVQHTHPTSSALPKSSLTATLRSGEVTPLMGMSPRASPRLLPQGPSGPITPLELSDENATSAHAGGYFGITPTTSSGGATSSSNLSSQASSTAGKQQAGGLSGGHHHHHHHHHHHQHHHKPHTSSHLHTASSFTSSSSETNSEMYTISSNDSGRQSRPRSAVSSRRSSTFALAKDAPVSAAEHPVLNTLQTMPHDHALPRYLDHDLGHDRVPLPPLPPPPSNSSLTLTPAPPAGGGVAVGVGSVLSVAPSTSPASNNTIGADTQPPVATAPSSSSSSLAASTATPSFSGRQPSLAASQQQAPPIFAMDREGPVPQSLGNQKLV